MSFDGWRLFGCVWWGLFTSTSGFAREMDPVDFNAEILPILSKNCFACHGPDDEHRSADLRLDTPDGALRSENPVILPGNAEASLLLQRIRHEDTDQRMPPPDSARQLTNAEVDLLRRWIQEGASWTGHWSFQPIRKEQPPEISRLGWSRHTVDDFIFARLEQHEMVPAEAAVPETLLRRVTFDLIGLPPSLSERNEFLSDNRPDAYERLVDRLLASPHFGERWGRHWLDAARYADSSGFEGDAPRTVWKYRDWVIEAFNEDLTFDAFVIKQLAGDLLPAATVDDRIATGFLLNSQQDGGSEPARLDAVVDRVNTLGTVYLGLTLGCAQCHSHKFDPLSQQEYYGLFAFVNAADERKYEFASPEELARRDALQSQVDALISERTAYTEKLPAELQKNDPGVVERTATIEQLSARIPQFDSALVLQDAPSSRVTTLFIRGDFSHPGNAVPPSVPHVLPPLPVESATRMDLAKWLVSDAQPLTPRVTVNRVWQQYFGRGLVETESDFGTQGARPSHPRLLNWLAGEFVQAGWRTKALHRLIVESATYRQSSSRNPEYDSIDPQNRWLSRQSRLRLEAEIIRDAALSVSGMLSDKIGGPSVFPFQHEGIMLNRATPAPWTMSPGEDRYRRGMYTFYWRLTPHPQMQIFDAPDAITACTRRVPSDTPLQALTLLNDPAFLETAEHLASRIPVSSTLSDAEAIDELFLLCLTRHPRDAEQKLLLDLLAATRTRFASLPEQKRELAAWTQVTRTLLNLEEFIVRE